MLSKEDKKQLKKISNTYQSIIQIGKEGLSYNIIQTLDDALEAHELVKCKLLKTSPISVNEAAIECARHTHSEIVHTIGGTFVLYRRSGENKMGLRK